jgi:hypothetical protein
MPPHAENSTDIKSNLAKMMQLRDQMLALRSKIRDSVQLLRTSIQQLQGGFNQYRFRDSAFPDLSADDREENASIRDEFELLNRPTEYPKAS